MSKGPEAMSDHKHTTSRSRSNTWIAAGCGALVAGMVGMSYAAVPLYQLFCQVTGYGGTTQVAEESSSSVIDRKIKVRFDANTAQGIGWSFKPAQREVELNVGANALAFYRAENRSQKRTVGTATFNVTPLSAGAYFNKIECFCFTEQVLEPGQSVDMPVSFFVDPEIDKDPDLANVTTITLSYTFFPSEESDQASAGSSDEEQDGGSVLN